MKIEIEKDECDEEINEIIKAATCTTVQEASIQMTKDTLHSMGKGSNIYKKKIELLSKFLITFQRPPVGYTCFNKEQILTSTEPLLIDPFIKHFSFFAQDDSTEMTVTALVMDCVLRNKNKVLRFGT